MTLPSVPLRAFALGLACLLVPLPLAAQQVLRPQGQSRLDRFDSIAGDALLRALAGGSAGDVAALTQALSGTPQVAFDESLNGDWRCRTMKLGGATALIVYSPFECRFSIRNDGFTFEKLTGSQLTRGNVTMRDGRAVYVGMGYAAGEDPPAYTDLPQDFRSDGSSQADVAILERIAPDRARLMFPAPAVDSDFDILELTR